MTKGSCNLLAAPAGYPVDRRSSNRQALRVGHFFIRLKRTSNEYRPASTNIGIDTHGDHIIRNGELDKLPSQVHRC